MTVFFKMDDGHTPRCLSQPTSKDVQCTKPVSHNQTDPVPIHIHGSLTWGDQTAFAKLHASPYQWAMNSHGETPRKITQLEDGSLRVTLHDPGNDADLAERMKAVGVSSPHGATELADWWREKAESEIEQTVEKAVEYGSTDLIDIGRSMARVAGRNTPDFSDSDAAMWGIFFYLEGKLSRWRSALERGSRPSLDTLLDIGVYARMAQRIVETGGWPGIEKEWPASLATTTSSVAYYPGEKNTYDEAIRVNEEIFHSMCLPDSPCGPNCTAQQTNPGRSAG